MRIGAEVLAELGVTLVVGQIPGGFPGRHGIPSRRLRPATLPRKMIRMRALISLVLVAAIGLGIYYVFLKEAAPNPNTPVTAAISTTGVQMDLTAIAQAERTYYTQSGSYATFDQLVASGDVTLTRPGRDGYTYAIETSSAGFTVTAQWTPPPGTPPNVHMPTYVIDETMQMRRQE
jgi:hypothetical protein